MDTRETQEKFSPAFSSKYTELLQVWKVMGLSNIENPYPFNVL